MLQGEETETVVGGFQYLGEMELLVVDPAQGSQAGGTELVLVGSGFPEDATVYVGCQKALDIEVSSPTTIACRAPAGPVGTVDVIVVSATKGTTTLPLADTWFDPESFYGGTWGEAVDGAVNVTVLDYGGHVVDGAFVMLWTDPETLYQGLATLEGQITFSGPDLDGEQMASASKEGCSSSSVVEYDAENLTLYLHCPECTQ